jgi:copper(I)-binding protein
MKRSRHQAIIRALVSVFVITALFSQTVWSEGLTIDKAWSLPLPPVSKNGAAYFSIKNHGPADKLLSASSDIAEQVEMHIIVHSEGQMKMQQLESVEVPMHGSVNFEPGGMHIMLVGLKEPLKEGNRYSLKLNFEKAGKVEVMIMVQMNPEGGKSQDHSDHIESTD